MNEEWGCGRPERSGLRLSAFRCLYTVRFLTNNPPRRDDHDLRVPELSSFIDGCAVNVLRDSAIGWRPSVSG